MRRAFILPVIAALLVAGCDSLLGDERGTVTAQPNSEGIRLHNTTSRTAFIFAVDERYLPAINWVQCIDGDRCIAVPPGERFQLPFDHIAIYSENTTDVRLFWWHAQPKPGSQPVPGPLRDRRVPLPR